MSDNPLTIADMVDRYPGTNKQTWAQMRYEGRGPRYFRVGRKIYYRRADVLDWEESGLQSRTDERPRAVAR